MSRRFDHVDLRVADLAVVKPFYATLLRALGFTRDDSSEEWFQFERPEAAVTEFFGICASPGHVPNENRIAFWAEGVAQVDEVARIARENGARNVEGPDWEAPHYYAVFFEDPAGNRLEVCHRTAKEPVAAPGFPDDEVLRVVAADLTLPAHQQAILALLDSYSSDPMGDGHPLSTEARARLIPGLLAHPTTLIRLAYVGRRPAGIAVCFRGFSTFAARPLLNIHDLAVLPAFRGRGIARLLLESVAEAARELGCCKLTLEVLENNHRARAIYEAAGFRQASYTEAAGGALFFARPL